MVNTFRRGKLLFPYLRRFLVVIRQVRARRQVPGLPVMSDGPMLRQVDDYYGPVSRNVP